MGADLVVIDKRLRETITYVKALLGDKMSPASITDEKGLSSIQENVATLIDLKKAVEEYFKPLKQEARRPYEKLLDNERKWMESIASVRDFAEFKIREFNDKKRAEIRAREQAGAEERAAAERARLEALKAQAEAAGNTETAQAIEEAKAATVVEVAEKKLVNRTELNTMSESETIEDFRITNHAEFAAALMSSGHQAIVVLDRKVETAFKKYLLANREVTAFPGIAFRRDYKTNFRARRTTGE